MGVMMRLSKDRMIKVLRGIAAVAVNARINMIAFFLDDYIEIRGYPDFAD